MGQFKPMVKMQTTEPSVELKLKKGGAVKKADGGSLMGGNPTVTSGVPARGGDGMAAMAPQRPSLAARRRAMMARPGGAGPAGPIGAAGRMMKEGGESKAEHKSEMKAIKGVKSELKKHEGKPASKGHKGLKTGGVVKSPKPGEYATGGVVDGQGGYKAGGIIKNEAGAATATKMDTAKVDRNSAPTGSVKLGNGGGYKKGGEAKKAYAAGGSVKSGAPVAMPQGRKKPSAPVSNDRQSGTFKTGGKVTAAEGRLQKNFASENKTAMRQAKAQSNEVYSKFQRKMASGGSVDDLSKGAYDKSIGPSEEEMDVARTIRGIPRKLYKGAKDFLGIGSVTESERDKIKEIMKENPDMNGQGAITEYERRTVLGKKKGGPACACK